MVFLLYPSLWMKRKYWEMGLWQKLLWLSLPFANRYMRLVALASGLLLAAAHLWNLRLRPACPRSGLSPRPNT